MKQVRSVTVSFDCMLRDIEKIILLTLTHPVKLTFPAEGINRRKPTTFGKSVNKLFPRAICPDLSSAQSLHWIKCLSTLFTSITTDRVPEGASLNLA